VTQQWLQFTARLRGGEAAQVLDVGRRAEAGRREQRERAHSCRRFGRRGDRHGAAEGVPDEVGRRDLDLVQKAEDRGRQRVEAGVADVLGRCAVPGQIEGVDPPAVGDRLLHELPAVAVAAVAVDEHDDVVAVAGHGGRQRAAVDDSGDDHGAGDVGDDARRQLLPRRRRSGGDVGLGDVRWSQEGDRAAHRDHLAGPGDEVTDHPLLDRLHRPGRLLRLDLDQFLAAGDLVALGHEPLDDRAARHRQAPLGHHDVLDALHVIRSNRAPS
jgi:hypothetical protein